MSPGDEERSPWPFRVDYRTGESRGPVSANMSFNLRLFDKLIEHGHTEFNGPRAKLWAWIKKHQIPNLAKGGSLWCSSSRTTRNGQPQCLVALNLARYLIEKKVTLDPDWKQDAHALIELSFTISPAFAMAFRSAENRPMTRNVGRRALHLRRGARHVLGCYREKANTGRWRPGLNFALYAVNEDAALATAR